MGRREEEYEYALRNKNIPLLTLDNKWHMLFGTADTTLTIKRLEEQLNNLLKRQGKLNTESKDIRRLKKKLMDEIVPTVDELGKRYDASLEKKLNDNKRLINDCNDKLAGYKDELLELPKEIEQVNYQLMLATMDVCYEKLKENTAEIDEIGEWITKIRVELKKKIIRKQEKEQQNQDLYHYMHAIFGADVIDIFDMKYNPEERAAKIAAEKERRIRRANGDVE
ncbi:MAG: hypothetical protein K2I22_15690 [Lachnospiraceae bacterium]|nr:hypothetical protein [Lachnospiraceae bacterium]